MEILDREQERLVLQARLQAASTQQSRNRLGQFATPTNLAGEILRYGTGLLGDQQPIRFLDPAIGTGSFFSALLRTVPLEQIEVAKGFEVDPHYAATASELWRETSLQVEPDDFTKAIPPGLEVERFNLVICNPPYVRHHHIKGNDKARLHEAAKSSAGISFSGLAGLYCYFLAITHGWLRSGGVAGWLIPSEFMDVNYGKAIKQYLLEKVTLLRIHRFDPDDVQFDDALVSSAVVWFRMAPPPLHHTVEFTFGGSLLLPSVARKVSIQVLQSESKWTRFPVLGDRNSQSKHYRISDLFEINRGVATGDNEFFILSQEQIESQGLPKEFFRPILPSARRLLTDQIEAGEDGAPVPSELFLLDCRLPEEDVKERYPELWAYLERGKPEVSKRYLCRNRKVWYYQEQRQPPPILCTYMGRNGKEDARPFRFILNRSKAIAPNVYLLLYPKPILSGPLAKDPTLLTRVWEALNNIHSDSLIGEGRVYGGGLYKLEPKELANVDATHIARLVPGM